MVPQGHIDEAVALCRKGLQFEPDFPNLHLNLGLGLLQQRKADEAISELTRAVELRPWYTEAYAALGQAFLLRGQQDEAVIQYRKALELDPDNSASRINLGLALARQGRSAEAVIELREAIRRDRLNPDAHHVLGTVFKIGLWDFLSGLQEFFNHRDHPQCDVIHSQFLVTGAERPTLFEPTDHPFDQVSLAVAGLIEGFLPRLIFAQWGSQVRCDAA